MIGAKRSIAVSLTVVVLIIFTVGQGTVWVWFLFAQRDGRLGVHVESMERVADFMAFSSAEAIANRDAEGLSRNVEKLSSYDDVLSVRVLDSDGRVIGAKTFRTAREPRFRFNPLHVPVANVLSVPVVSGGSRIGTVELQYSAKKVNDAMSEMLTLPVVVEALVLLLVVTGIFLYLNISVGRPLGVLQERIRGITGGDLTVSIPDYGNNEIGVIASGLRFLVRTLLSNISKINQTAENVARVTAQVNKTFDNVNRDIKGQSEANEGIIEKVKLATESQKDIADGTEKLSEISAENVSFLLEVKSASDEIVSSSNRLFSSAEDSYSVVAEMSQTSKAMSENTREVLAHVDETVASIEELRASVKEVEASAKESSALAENVRTKAAQEGTLVVAEAIEGMEEITDKVTKAVEMVRRLETRSADIQKILSVIRDVTEQTNLLSLNAAILAEQAGEYGKGFAVVADEMRQLSDRTASSTKEISSIVRTIQDEIQRVMQSIEEGMKMADRGVGLVNSVGESMGSILNAAQSSSRMAGAIERATEEQVSSLDLVAASMADISMMVSNMANAMAEQMAGSEHMLERVGEVREVAEITKKSTVEQAEGTGMMSKHIENASAKISQISAASYRQMEVNQSIVAAIEDIRALGDNTLRHVNDMTLLLNNLTEEIAQLRKEMGSFKVG